MATEFTIRHDPKDCGSMVVEDPRPLRARRMLDGVVLLLRFVVDLRWPEDAEDTVLLSEASATASAFGLDIGQALDHTQFPANNGSQNGTFELRLSSGVVRALEAKRNGGQIDLSLVVQVTTHIVSWVPLASSLRDGKQGDSTRVIGPPVKMQKQANVKLEAQPWSDMLKNTGYGENVFVEIPLPRSSPPEWDEVWKALRTARDRLISGTGSSAWKTVVSECRNAFEIWERIEEVDHGAGRLQATKEQREGRTISQRRDAQRWHAHQIANYFLHSPVDECTRDDAVLVLSTLAGLLAARKP